MALRAVLLAAAGAASLAYLALRHKPPAHRIRELELRALAEPVLNWLPRLPYLGYLQLRSAGRPLLRITGDGDRVGVHLLPQSYAEADIRPAFRRTAERLGLHVREGASGLIGETPADPQTLTRALDALLREVFGLTDTSMLQAEVPGGTPRRAS